MNAPKQKSTGIVQKAITALQEQQESHKSALDTLKTLKLALVEEFEAAKVHYPAEITKIDKKISQFERELHQSEATISKLRQIA